MALKNMIKVGDKVSFGRGSDRRTGKVLKKNPKTARIKVPRDGEFLVTYNLIHKSNGVADHYHEGAKSLRVGVNVSKARKAAAAKKKPAKKKVVAKKPRQKATGKKICATPVAKRMKSNPAAVFTKKGERVYNAIKSGYGRDPRAKEIAARTVYKMAETKPGLVKKSALKDNPYTFGQESHKVRRETAPEWGEDTLGHATTEHDLYEQEPTRQRYQRGQTRDNPTAYEGWIHQRSTSELKSLKKALETIVRAGGADAADSKRKLLSIKKEMNLRARPKQNPAKKPLPGYPATYSRPRVRKERGVPLRKKIATFLHVRLGDPAMPEYALSEADQNRFADAFMDAVLPHGKLNIAAERAGRQAGKAAVGASAWNRAEDKAREMRSYYDAKYSGSHN
jgi:hypothetical protein